MPTGKARARLRILVLFVLIFRQILFASFFIEVHHVPWPRKHGERPIRVKCNGIHYSKMAGECITPEAHNVVEQCKVFQNSYREVKNISAKHLRWHVGAVDSIPHLWVTGNHYYMEVIYESTIIYELLLHIINIEISACYIVLSTKYNIQGKTFYSIELSFWGLMW